MFIIIDYFAGRNVVTEIVNEEVADNLIEFETREEAVKYADKHLQKDFYKIYLETFPPEDYGELS